MSLSYKKAVIFTSFIFLLIFIFYSLSLGRFHTSFLEILALFKAKLFNSSLQNEELLTSVVINTRLPRVLAGVLIGSILAVAGAFLQALFKNPLLSPAILGVLNGAAFGASLGLILHFSFKSVTFLACVFGIVAVSMGLMIAKKVGNGSILVLILGGLVSNAVFAGGVSFIKFIADPQDELPSIVFWLLGSLNSIQPSLLYTLAPFMLTSLLLLLCLGRVLDVFCLGDEEALCLGVSVYKLRFLLSFLVCSLCALVVCLAGVIGWVGLLVPHLIRLLIGPSNTTLLPQCAIGGGGFLLFCDDLARCLSSAEIPLGVITQLLGAFLFFLLLLRGVK